MYRDYFYLFANVCMTFSNIFSKEIISNNTKCSYEPLKILGKWNRWWNPTCVCPIFLNFEIHFFEFSFETFFGVISVNWLYLYLLQNAKRTLIYFYTFRYKVLILKLLDFLSDFVLISFLSNKWEDLFKFESYSPLFDSLLCKEQTAFRFGCRWQCKTSRIGLRQSDLV